MLFTALALGIIILLGVAVYYFAYEQAFQDFDIRLELRANIAARTNFDQDQKNQEVYENLRKQHLQRLPSEEEFIIRADTIDRIHSSRLFALTGEDFFQQLESAGKANARHNFQFATGISSQQPTGKYYVIVTAFHPFAENFLTNLSRILTIASIVSAIVLFSVGIVFSRQVLAPIRNITRKARKITVTSLNERLPVAGGSDEISSLSLTFNEMLSRLETAFETQHHFVGNASHELNTPLTAIIGETDLALSRPRTPEEYQATLKVVMQQAEKLRGITHGLLELAQSGVRDNLRVDLVPVDELMEKLIRVAREIFSEATVIVNRSLQPEGLPYPKLKGNERLYELALSNLLLNACKYANDKPVTIAYTWNEKMVIFLITDHGIGIPEKDLPHIFDPFFRASNVIRLAGFGIGLPLARNIIQFYKGTLEIRSKEGEGTEAEVRFPLSGDSNRILT